MSACEESLRRQRKDSHKVGAQQTVREGSLEDQNRACAGLISHSQSDVVSLTLAPQLSSQL